MYPMAVCELGRHMPFCRKHRRRVFLHKCTLTDSEDLGEMPHNEAFHQDIHYLL